MKDLFRRWSWWLPGFVGLCCLLLVASPVQAEDPDLLYVMQQANQLYEEARFGEASILYERLIEHGVQDAVVYYNLGNAYFKQDQLGEAILAYRLAQRLAPRDPDIRDNLALARRQTQDPIDFTDGTLLSRLTRFAQEWLTINEMAWATLFFWASTAVLIVLYTYLRMREGRLRLVVQVALAASIVLLAGGIFSLSGRLYIENVRPQGVILESEIPVTSGPGSQYVMEFVLHAGTEVEIIEERNNWLRLTLPGDQLQGWVPISAVGQVRSW